ncbi:MAG: hypothetical protein JXM69_21405 [Anaerolineae bacterium]|nr:hypothetical protein [Anaerolineae bacterium]
MSTITRHIIVALSPLFLGVLALTWSQPISANTSLLAGVPEANPAGATMALTSTTGITETEMAPTYIKGLYLTYHAVGHEGLRSHAFGLIETTELNAVVIDIKGDLGLLAYQSDVITATAIGANEAPTIQDWPALRQYFDDHNIYAIARIVVFKDNYMARAHPEWAVKDASGQLWLDREKLPWTEAFHEEVWDYNIALAVEAAQRGFDEIQFDYVRFPTDGSIGSIVYSQPADTPAARTQAINGFLAKADAALAPYPVKLAVDVFGYTTWHKGDFRIGQDLAQMAPYLDVLSPMLYPSTFDHGLDGMPGYEFAVDYPYEIVYESMIRVMGRVKATNPNLIVRPWLQDFPDYGFDRRIFTPDEVREQMFASYDTGGGGWLLWDPRVKYTPEALVSSNMLYPPNENGDVMVLRYQNFTTDEAETEETRNLASFRRDLEQLWAAGYYPVNLRDLAVGNWNFRRDIADRLRHYDLPPLQADALLQQNLFYVPAGKRPVALTFDGSHLSQYRQRDDGSLDPNSAVGVLDEFHRQHPADWPLRATFFVQTQADDPADQLFGQPEWAAQKLQTLVDGGMEVGLYANGPHLSTAPYEALRRQLEDSKTLLETTIPAYRVDSLAFPLDTPPRVENRIRRGFYNNLFSNYYAVATNSDRTAPSPHVAAFDPHHIPRIQATAENVATWLEFYAANPGRPYVAAGIFPEVRSGQ